MLIVRKKYESLDKILKNEADEIDEAITDKGFTKFKKSLKDSPEAELLSDSEITNYSKEVTKYARKQAMTAYDKFFEQHGISSRKEDVINLFLKNDNADKLKEIIDGDGLVSESQLTSESDLLGLCKGFEDEAATMAMWDGRADGKAFGKYELLLRMILKGGNAPETGDVGIGSKLLEVKATNTGKKRDSPAHPSYQGVKRDTVIFKSIDDVFNSISKSKKSKNKSALVEKPGEVNYTQMSGIDIFNELLSKYYAAGGKADDITNAIVDGVLYQYGSHAGGVKSSLDAIAKEYKSQIAQCKITPNDLRDMIGRMQVCAYCSNYDYFMVINNRNMRYLIMNSSNCVEKSKQLQYGTISTKDTSWPTVNIRYNG